MNIEKTKTIIGGLVSKLSTINEEDYDKSRTFEEFTKPFFETLGWDFQTDVKKPDSITENKADYAFQIDGVSRFYLSVVPPSKSLEDRKQILPLTGFAYNKGVTWAILTNFKETRVYNTEAPGTSPRAMQHFSFAYSEYISKFEDLLNLTKKQFSLNVLDSDAVYFGKKPKRVPIDQQLLKDLLSYRDMLVDDITKNNSITEEEVKQAVQKILNRLIFVRSCGDRQIEERHLKSMLGDWNDNKNKKLVEYLREIFAYFRGRYGSSLFEKHACDNLIISDRVLEEIIKGLYASKEKSFLSYDFSLISSDVLGKMYENYLGTVQRKQDGAYYTPNYISKYIAENTIIPYLSKSDVTNIPDLISEYANNIKELESKIHNIKILDPACGTGEFLIRAIDVLLKISKAIQNHKEKSGKYSHIGKKKKSESVTYATFDKEVEGQELRTIIQNNIFGVDINEEAIEITQLNLFLKLATSSQQLLDVSKNLRIGNALIGDKSVDPKAFDWKQAFPEKFDIIIGNPPYVNIQLINEKEKKFLFNNYKTASGRFDFYVLFYEKSIYLLNNEGFLSFITSNKFFKTKSGTNLRKEIIDNLSINKIIDFGEMKNGKVFAGLTTYPVIINLKKILSDDKTKFEYIKVKSISNSILNNKNIEKIEINQNSLSYDKWKFLNKKTNLIYEKILSSSSISLRDISELMYAGLITGDNETFILSSEKIKKFKIEKELLKPLPKAINIRRFHIDWNDDAYILYPYKKNNQKTSSVINLDDYPNTKKYLLTYKNLLESRKSLQNTNKKWFELMRPRKFHWFQTKKIVTPNLSKTNNFSLDFYESKTNNFFVDHDAYGIVLKNDSNDNYYYILGILNSKLIDFFIKQSSPVFSGGYYKYHNQYFENIPIIQNNSKITKQCIELVKKIIDDKNIEKSTEIDENKLDELVYKLYNITEEEKKIIESSI